MSSSTPALFLNVVKIYKLLIDGFSLNVSFLQLSSDTAALLSVLAEGTMLLI
ncbi:hypothetical protein SRABI27_01025 [Pedobacter sp. Bi27]|nr:hypothetical protein SRABI126_01029 [Pedobacter sp. Bi126]CAH0171363.1 hypothetical protein SRABI27_01025 [Pedobacter sp. Bi27]CAH0288668.1 hypothetical protein SRABI36_04240 [Pedobacter sp. Bi36]